MISGDEIQEKVRKSVWDTTLEELVGARGTAGEINGYLRDVRITPGRLLHFDGVGAYINPHHDDAVDAVTYSAQLYRNAENWHTYTVPTPRPRLSREEILEALNPVILNQRDVPDYAIQVFYDPRSRRFIFAKK